MMCYSQEHIWTKSNWELYVYIYTVPIPRYGLILISYNIDTVAVLSISSTGCKDEE